ncbi:zinc ribbon domain-containing protein [Mycoplasma sp. P36-A1]|uniref:zinc ribbon domain-containing protein n=1 Tax=Mycoplasma sp. P36-A1 TaxID=3252900 RepID=UPI003C30BBB0
MGIRNVRYCQSCGLPLYFDNTKNATEIDGSINEDYCCDCYHEGYFIHQDITLDEMITMAAPKVSKYTHIPIQDAINALKVMLPELTRWA